MKLQLNNPNPEPRARATRNSSKKEALALAGEHGVTSVSMVAMGAGFDVTVILGNGMSILAPGAERKLARVLLTGLLRQEGASEDDGFGGL